MSFDLGPINKNLSSVQASSKTTDGGGGNTGFFRRGQKEEEINLGKAKDYPEDSYEAQGTLDEIQEQSFMDIIKNLILDLIDAVKNFFIKSNEK